jgi:hypothetical protein
MVKRMNIGDKSRRMITALAVCAALLMALASPAFAAPTVDEQNAADATGGEIPAAVTDENGDATDGTDVPVDPPQPVSISITGYPRNMTVGDRDTIKYEVENAEANAKVKWASGDDDIATVDSDGEVRAFAAGKVEITASLGDARASILISVEEKVILPESFSVDVEEFTAADTLLATHDLKKGDELHISAKIIPSDADINGKFEWDTSRNGIVAIEVTGEINENAALTAKSAGEVTLTVRYADETVDESKRVALDDYRLVLTIAEEEVETANSLLITILIAAAAVAAITLITVVIVRSRRHADDERRARRAHKEREMVERENAERDERERLIMEGYERGYKDSEADRFEGMTRVYGELPTAPPEPGRLDADNGYEPSDENDEPEKPFSVDDIE